MVEKRSHKRFEGALPITFRSSEDEYSGISMDFSASGLFILTTEPLTPGTILKLSLEVTRSKKIWLSGVVVRTIKTGNIKIKNGMAIKLNEMPFLYHQLLESIDKTVPQLRTEEPGT